MKPSTNYDVRRIRELRDLGLPRRQIAEELRLSASRIRYWTDPAYRARKLERRAWK